MHDRMTIGITATVAIVAPATLSGCAMSGPTVTDHRAAIQRVLRADTSLAKLRNDRVREVSLATATREYAASLENLDYWNAPPGFEAAFLRHAEAWRNFADAAEPFADIRAEMHEAIEKADTRGGPQADRLLDALDEVWATWAPIERLAAEYGVEAG